MVGSGPAAVGPEPTGRYAVRQAGRQVGRQVVAVVVTSIGPENPIKNRVLASSC